MAGQTQSKCTKLGGRDLQAVGPGELCVDVCQSSWCQPVDTNPIRPVVLVTVRVEANSIWMANSTKLRKPGENGFVLVRILPTVVANSRIFGVLDLGPQLFQTFHPFTNPGRSHDRVRIPMKEMDWIVECIRSKLCSAFRRSRADGRECGPEVGPAQAQP